MKGNYDKKSEIREVKVGDKVLIINPVVRSLQAKFEGPFTVVKVISPLTVVVATPDKRRKEQHVHNNRVKKYYDSKQTVCAVGSCEAPATNNNKYCINTEICSGTYLAPAH